MAAMAAEPSVFPSVRLKWHIHSFTRMEAAKMATDTGRSPPPPGGGSLPMEVLPSSSPTRRIIRDTSSPERYSAGRGRRGGRRRPFCPPA